MAAPITVQREERGEDNHSVQIEELQTDVVGFEQILEGGAAGIGIEKPRAFK
jgi:hypothetical protein